MMKSAPIFLLAITVALFGTVVSAGGQCDAQLKTCGGSAAKNAPGVAKSLGACKALRVCKRTCRKEKRGDLRNCRKDKRSCRKQCRSVKRGKARRNCRKKCRQEKRRCASEARKEKRVCKDECRSTYKTAACIAARKKIVGSVVKTVGSCIALVACLAANSG